MFSSVQSPSRVRLFATPWIEARQASLCGYVRDTEFSAYVEGKKEGDNLSRLSITTTDFCLYVSTDLLIHPWPFFFFFNSLCLNLRVSFYIVKYFLWISLSLSLFFFFAYKGQHLLFSSSVADFLSLWSSKVPPCGNHWDNFMGFFQIWVIAHCIYVPYFFKI